MKNALRFTAALTAVFMLCVPAFASDSDTVRCKGGIVSVGDSAGEVLFKCGQPATTTQSAKKVIQKGQSGPTTSVTNVIVDNWIFNFGPNEFQYQLEVQDGRVSRIQSLDRGY